MHPEPSRHALSRGHRSVERQRRDRAGTAIPALTISGVAVGIMEPPSIGDRGDDLTPARSSDGRFALWLAGEITASADPWIPLTDVDESRTLAFRQALLVRWQKGKSFNFDLSADRADKVFETFAADWNHEFCFFIREERRRD